MDLIAALKMQINALNGMSKIPKDKADLLNYEWRKLKIQLNECRGKPVTGSSK
jgi:hypothetical protein